MNVHSLPCAIFAVWYNAFNDQNTSRNQWVILHSKPMVQTLVLISSKEDLRFRHTSRVSFSNLCNSLISEEIQPETGNKVVQNLQRKDHNNRAWFETVMFFIAIFLLWTIPLHYYLHIQFLLSAYMLCDA